MPSELLDGVYDITCAETETGRIRAFLFADGTLVDCGIPEATDALLEGIEATGVEPRRLVLTHADRDHAGGFDAVVREHWVETWVPEGATPATDYEPDHRYGHGDEVGAFEAVHVPGHRSHQHALVDEAGGVAVLADAVSGSDQRGLPEGYFHLPPGVYTDDLHQAEASLDRLAGYEFDAGLVYHGSSVLSNAADKLRAYVHRPDTA
jgi:glyoxylase-like metal-dependent hydrolase (beta-lactamase superfamily II)